MEHRQGITEETVVMDSGLRPSAGPGMTRSGMFTGIVTEVGEVIAVDERGERNDTASITPSVGARYIACRFTK